MKSRVIKARVVKSIVTHALAAAGIACSAGAITILGQSDTVEAHRAAAKAAAGQDHLALLTTVCPERAGAVAPGSTAARAAAGGTGGGGATAGAARGRGAAGAAATSAQPATGTTTQTAGASSASGAARGATASATPRATPARASWHAEPVKVFDNLYFVGQSEYSAWAVTTSDGIIILDTIFDYSVEDEIVEGLKKLGLDPTKIKYAVVSHGHGDHSGGAKYLQDHFGTRILLSAADWDLLDRSNGTKPTRDIVVTDGQKLTLGDTTITMYLTPGHTPGTLSMIIPVKDNGQPHVIAEWGGTAFNFTVTPGKPREYWFSTYIASAERFKDVALKAGADGVIANHTNFDGSKTKLPKLATRKPGDPHPYIIGTEAVQRYLTVASECAKAGLGELNAGRP
jgi:metallo-beta-lactamase class B